MEKEGKFDHNYFAIIRIHNKTMRIVIRDPVPDLSQQIEGRV